MAFMSGDKPRYTRYRATPRLRGRAEETTWERGALGQAGGPPRRQRRSGEAPAGPKRPWRERITPKRVLLGLTAGWLLLSLVLFLLSAHFERTSPPSDVAAALKPSGFPLTSANNVLV